VKEDITESTTLKTRYLNEVKGYVKKKRKHLSYVGMDIFKGLNTQVLICYFSDGE